MISVVIPVYNVEKYLKRCLGSLLAQTWSDWEALCVDDGSSDASLAILEEYAARDGRIKVFHRSNGGAAKARNFALDKVEGEYLMLLDSDDFIHPQTMELCMYMAHRDSSDLVTYTYNHRYRTVTLLRQMLHLGDPRVKFAKYVPSEVETIVSDNIFDWATEYSKPKDIDPKWAIKHCHPVRCIYRTEAIRGMRFTEGIIYEDFPWWSEMLLRVKKVTIMRLPLYYYYPNFKGYILSSSEDYRIDSLKCAIAAAEAVYNAQATPQQLEAWRRNFLSAVTAKLEKKIRKAENKR